MIAKIRGAAARRAQGGRAMKTMTRVRRVLTVAVVAITLAGGCAATRARTSEPERAGFLGDYTGLIKNPAYPAALVYLKPGVQWARYSAIQLDSAGAGAKDGKNGLSAERTEEGRGGKEGRARGAAEH